ncbi:Pectinesterase inhibitor [Corchorus capsularis]|uniref:Pectinesterase inhibitor n=1 Tax=Corchorus capsularis TaxID=210143 RepID=A0A1R3JAQ9_COCAP|nr:Pectinesterase inhibitor [Corchorus capsularis]
MDIYKDIMEGIGYSVKDASQRFIPSALEKRTYWDFRAPKDVVVQSTFLRNITAQSKPNITKDDINTICSKTRAPSFCFRVLTNQTLHAKETSLLGLANISIDLALASAYDTQLAISPLIKLAKDYTEREGYTLCSQNYRQAVAAVRDAKQKLGKHEYRGVRVEALAAVEEARACESRVKSSAYSPLHERNKGFIRYCNILWAITNRLVEYC